MENLIDRLRATTTVYEKIEILDSNSRVQRYKDGSNHLKSLFAELSPEFECALKQLIVIGQWENIVGEEPIDEVLLKELLEKLVPIDQFYRELGGIVGYHATILKFLKEGAALKLEGNSTLFHSPSFIDITNEDEDLQKTLLAGIESLPMMAEIYPLGGAADRLHLVDELSGVELPAAKLEFNGRTLLEGLIRDLQAKEYLYFKLFGKEITTPIAIMTSLEKGNYDHVQQIFIDQGWFGRGKKTIHLFCQPLVPTVDAEGNWCLLSPYKPLLKPGGHGAIWKLAKDSGVISWLVGLGRKKAIVRQINNPAAGLDYGLLVFAGHGFQKERVFGFASCPRLIQSAEGVNVLIEKNRKELVLSNIEYCDFEKFGIEDLPLLENGIYSKFSSNTNILFADLEAILDAIDKCPYPGLLINLKKQTYTSDSGEKRELSFARLESTMQNIADVFVEEKKERLETERTFVTYNHRHKTISTAKKGYIPEGPTQETPENCFYELTIAARELLEGKCSFELPPKRSLREVLKKGPEFYFLYHPALGPTYSIIGQKVQGGKMALGSSLELDIVDLEIKGLSLSGALSIYAEQPVGHFDSKGILHYSNRTGRCSLRNVRVKNKGVDWENSTPFWRNRKKFVERVEIHLLGCSELIAENVVFVGGTKILVEDQTRLTIEQKGDQLLFKEEKLQIKKPFWNYKWIDGVKLTRN